MLFLVNWGTLGQRLLQLNVLDCRQNKNNISNENSSTRRRMNVGKEKTKT